MKKILLLCFFMLGCSARPEYYSHTQSITLDGISGKTEVLYQGQRILSETEKMNSSWFESHPDEKNWDQRAYVIYRSWNDNELIIKKYGFKDYHLKLDSTMTSEPWATAEYPDGNRHYFPLIGLLFPVKTIKAVVSVPYYLLRSVFSLITISPIGLSANIVQMGDSLIDIPFALASDLYGILGVPGTVIVNPWTEYKHIPVVILEPTDALKNECNTQKNAFISNNGCSDCYNAALVMYSSQQECNKCSNRYWDEGKCLIK